MEAPAADRILNISTPAEFSALALEVFHFQAANNAVYRSYLQGISVTPAKIRQVDEIPYFPVEFFKSHRVICEGKEAALVFESSGTTGAHTSRHFVVDPGIYQRSFLEGFRRFYGDIQEYVILALLPSYLEREHSSLVYMADTLIRKSGKEESGFYLDDYQKLSDTLGRLERKSRPCILLGVSFALVEFCRAFPMQLSQTLVMETGGMKGRMPEMTRAELHQTLKRGFGLDTIHSEYGMTELLSQAWSRGNGVFRTPPWMKIRIRDPFDPLSAQPYGRSGGIDIIDLANLWSCSFLSVQDIGRMQGEGDFEVLGRFDQSDIRGCNLMME